ncbi:MAG: HAMP domain-containing protein [Bacteroidetes bacterium]|nr:HAMP domain-containing protein [Bacteroidota bacterium]
MKLTAKLKHISISTRISILLGLIILVTMGIFSAVSLMKQQRDSVDALSRSTLLLSQTTEKILRLSMLKNRRDEISTAIKDIVENEGIRSVRILNHEGIIKFSSRHSELNEHISRTNRLCTNCHVGRDSTSIHAVSSFYSYHFDERNGIIYSSLPIYNSPDCYNSDCHATTRQEPSLNIEKPGIGPEVHPVHDSSQTILGFIEIEVSAKRIMTNLDKSRSQLILLTILIALAASTIVYFSIRYLVGKPVRRLVDGTRRVAQGDFNNDIPSGEAELGVLVDSFNKMQRQLLSTQSQLIESEKLASVGKLADGIANEISKAVIGIIIYTESLIAQSKLGNDEKADCQTILQEALKIRESVRNILSLARKEKPRFVPVDIDTTIRHAVSVLEKLSDFRNIRVIVSVPKDLQHVSADPGMMEQVFLNLLMISSENIAAGGILNVSAVNMSKENKIEIRFAHSGRGIPDNVLHALTKQNAGPDFENIERTKISLTVCREIVALHKGRIYAGSEPGTATSIVIELPA